jgi:hypothetical protein
MRNGQWLMQGGRVLGLSYQVLKKRRAMKYSLLQASPEEIKKKQEDADRAMRELLDEEGKKPTLLPLPQGKTGQDEQSASPVPLTNRNGCGLEMFGRTRDPSHKRRSLISSAMFQ